MPLKAEPAACSGNGYLTPLRPPRSGENPRGRVNTKTNFYFNKVNSQQCDTEGEGFSRCRGKKAGVLTQRCPSPSPQLSPLPGRGQSSSGCSSGGDPTPQLCFIRLAGPMAAPWARCPPFFPSRTHDG